jgi:hypothetical protein
VSIRHTIRGAQEARAACLSVLANLRPDGALGRAVRDATAAADRYAVSITRVDTGAWRASHRPEVDGLHGRLALDPSTTNPRSGSRPVVYGAIWEERGGKRAVYARTVNEAGEDILQTTGLRLYRSLP